MVSFLQHTAVSSICSRRSIEGRQSYHNHRSKQVTPPAAEMSGSSSKLKSGAPEDFAETSKLVNHEISRYGSEVTAHSRSSDQGVDKIKHAEEQRLVRKVDLRLCTVAGILASLDLLDSNIISAASVTTMFEDLDLGVGNRYSVSIFIFTISSIIFQLPATIAVRYFGPRIFFSLTTFAFGLITMCTAFVQSWREMIALRVLLGISMSGIYPGLSYLISCWYTRKEQQLRFAFLQTGEVFILATGGLVNYGLQKLSGHGGLEGWRWMFLVQGLVACLIGILTYWWMPMLPDSGYDRSFRFLSEDENKLACARIEDDRKDSTATPFTWKGVLRHSKDVKVYGFAVMFFLLNLVSTALSYFLPIILQGGMGFSTGKAIILNSPPYYYAIIPVLITSYISDRFSIRGPVIVFNSICLIVGFAMLGFTTQPAVRYVGTCLATGAYVSNWAALTAFYANNIAGQWKRVWTAAVVTAFNGAGGIAGSFIFRQEQAPRYITAIWTAIG